MHYIILPVFSIVLTGTTLLFSELRVLTQTLEPRRVGTATSVTGKFILAHVHVEVSLSKYLQITILYYLHPNKLLLSNDVNCYILCWLADGTMVRRIGHWKVPSAWESNNLGLIHKCRQSSCAVYYALTIRLGMGRGNHLWSSSVHMSTGSQWHMHVLIPADAGGCKS